MSGESTSTSSDEMASYIIMVIFSGYKTELHDRHVKSFLIRATRQQAYETMRKMATDLYERDAIIQEASDKYFNEYEDCIYFGENRSYGIGYRSSWGLLKMEKTEICSV